MQDLQRSIELRDGADILTAVIASEHGRSIVVIDGRAAIRISAERIDEAAIEHVAS